MTDSPSEYTAAQASDPSTPLDVLAQIAYRRPDLRPDVARNPAAYPGLLEWLGGLGDPAVDSALAARSGSPVPPGDGDVAAVPNEGGAGAPAPTDPTASGATTSAAAASGATEPVQAPPVDSSAQPGSTWVPASGVADPLPAAAVAGDSLTAGGPAAAGEAGREAVPVGATTGAVVGAGPLAGAPAGPGGGGERPPTGSDVPAERPRRRWKVAAIAAGAVVLAGGAAFAATQLWFSDRSGAATPEEAATQLVEGLGDLDGAAIVGALSPAEFAHFDSIGFDTDSLLDENRLDERVLDSGRRIIEALDVSVKDVDVRSEEIADGVAKVFIVDGTLTVDGDADEIVDAALDLSEVLAESWGSSLGTGVTDLPTEEDRREGVESLEEELPYTADAQELGESLARQLDLPDDEAYPFVVAVEEDGRWYVSTYLTVAEYAWTAAGGGERGRIPAADDLKEFDDAESAASGMVEGVQSYLRTGDRDELLTVLPLVERRLAGLYLPDGFEGLGSQVDVVEITDDSFRTVREDGDLREVVFDGFTVSIDADGEQAEIGLDSPCIALDVASESLELCLDEIPLVREFNPEEFAFVAVEEDGRWFVSPFLSLAKVAAVLNAAAAELSDSGKLEDQDWIQGQLEELYDYLDAQVPGLGEQLRSGSGSFLGGAAPVLPGEDEPVDPGLGLGGEVPAEQGAYGSDPELDLLWDACEGGDLQACDDLYLSSPVGTQYEEVGDTCAYRREAGEPASCLDTLG